MARRRRPEGTALSGIDHISWLCPMVRLAERGWCTMDAMSTIMTRQHVIDLNEYLDAIEEAEEVARLKVERDAKRGSG